MSVFCIDLATTGVIDYSRSIDESHQPRIVSVACALYEDGREIAVFDSFIRPDGFTVPEASTRIHGVGHRVAVKYGIPLKTALSVVMNMAALAPTAISYGFETFDAKVIRGELAQIKVEKPFPPTGVAWSCVKSMATEFCRLEGEGGRYRRPTLDEAAQAILGESPANTTLANMRACASIYFELRKKGFGDG